MYFSWYRCGRLKEVSKYEFGLRNGFCFFSDYPGDKGFIRVYRMGREYVNGSPVLNASRPKEYFNKKTKQYQYSYYIDEAGKFIMHGVSMYKTDDGGHKEISFRCGIRLGPCDNVLKVSHICLKGALLLADAECAKTTQLNRRAEYVYEGIERIEVELERIFGAF